VPPLALSGVGSTIATSPTLKHKILLLNGSYDRESDGLDAVEFVSRAERCSPCSCTETWLQIRAVTDHLNGSIRHPPSGSTRSPLSSSQLLHPERDQNRYQHQYTACDYITHLFYLEQSSIPVDMGRLEEMGIQAVAIPGSRFSDTTLATAMTGVLSSEHVGA
jgi:hypothetical protein